MDDYMRTSVISLSVNHRSQRLTLVFLYSDDFAERVIRNLINDPSFCKSCGLFCDSCKYNAYSHVVSVRAAIELRRPTDLPPFIDNPEKHMPKKLPEADLAITSGLHKDLLLELPYHLEKAGIKGLIVPIENFVEVPSGLKKQLEEKCQELSLETAFPKPFCSLEPADDKQIVSRFANELHVGRPLLEIFKAKIRNRRVIESAIVRRSAPCGSTWYIAKKLTGVDTKKEILYDAIAKAHHSYPCTATMETDPEAKEPILHIAGYIIRDEVKKALERAKDSS